MTVPVVAVLLIVVAVMTPRFAWFLVAREIGLRRAIRVEHARQEREAVGKLHWIAGLDGNINTSSNPWIAVSGSH